MNAIVSVCYHYGTSSMAHMYANGLARGRKSFPYLSDSGVASGKTRIHAPERISMDIHTDCIHSTIDKYVSRPHPSLHLAGRIAWSKNHHVLFHAR